MTMKTGIGLRAAHHADVLQSLPDAGFLEVHAENYFHTGGVAFSYLRRCHEHYPVSLHGVGLSLGSADGIDDTHLEKFKTLADAIDPFLVSDHVSWSAASGRHVPDLLPLPMTSDALDIICANIDKVQSRLKRRLLVENPSVYLDMAGEMTEPDFIAAITRRTGCGLLLDVNNIYVSARNTGGDALAYLNALPRDIVGEIHVAGHEDKGDIVIDAHNNKVCDDVWALYAAALQKFGDVPTLVEWDSNIPALSVLMDEARKADNIRKKVLHEQAT